MQTTEDILEDESHSHGGKSLLGIVASAKDKGYASLSEDTPSPSWAPAMPGPLSL